MLCQKNNKAFMHQGVTIMRPTKRAPDGWESARFISFFLASSLYCSQAGFSPAAGNAGRYKTLILS